MDDYWYYARNVDNDDQEGMILASNMKIAKRMAGEDAVVRVPYPPLTLL